MTGKNISGVVLAGGSGKRLGGITKSKILIDCQTIIDRMLRVMENIFDEIIIVTDRPHEFEYFNHHKITSDIFKKKGPLGGIHAAIKSSTNEAVFVFAGDMPFIRRSLIESQINLYGKINSDALVPVIGSGMEPLHAIYKVSLLDSFTEYLSLNTDMAVREFLKKVNVTYMQMEDTADNRLAFTNINTPDDLDKFRKAR